MKLAPRIAPAHPVIIPAARRFAQPGWFPDLLILLAFLAVSYILLLPLAQYFINSTVSEGDSLLQMWILGHTSEALLNNPAQLFDGNIFYPYANTIAYSDHGLANTLLGLPIYWLGGGNIVLEYNALVWLSFALSGWFTYLLVKDISGSRAGGVVAGMVFAFGTYRFGHLSQLNLLSTQWIPLCFLFLRRILLLDNPREEAAKPLRQRLKQGWWLTAGLAVSFTLHGLSTFYYLFFILPLLVIYFVGHCIAGRRLPSPGTWLNLAVAAGVAVACIVPTLLPYLAVVTEQNAQRTPREVEQFSANYRFYFATLKSNLSLGSFLSRFAGSGGERALFPGIIGVLLAVIALAAPVGVWLWRKIRGEKSLYGATDGGNQSGYGKERVIFAVIGVFSFLMSLGWTFHLRGWDIPGLYRLFYYNIPGWVAMRVAMRYGVFVTFAVAVLAGIGTAWLLAKLLPRWQAVKVGRFSLPTLATLGVAIVLAGGIFWESRHEVTYINPAILPNPPEVYRWLNQPENAGVMVELPAPLDPLNPPSIRNYYNLFSQQPMLNGGSSYFPPVMLETDKLINQFPTPEGLALFQGVGVRWLVYFLEDENTPLAAAEWQKTEARLVRTPQVKLVHEFANPRVKVYELAANPWMQQAVAGLPDGAGIYLSDLRRQQPALIEYFAALVRRNGHDIYGNERAGFRYLKPPTTGVAVNAGLFAADENPAPFGFNPANESWSGYGLKFYRRQTPAFATYDIAHSENLAQYRTVNGKLELGVETNRLTFNGNSLGNGNSASGAVSVKATFSSFGKATLLIDGKPLALPGGLLNWQSGELAMGSKINLSLATGSAPVYIERAELIPFQTGNKPDDIRVIAEAALLTATTQQAGDRLQTTAQVYAPPLPTGQATKYVLTLDIYRKPWGTHPNGHFGTYSIALNGDDKPHNVTFSFSPTQRLAEATIDGGKTDLGSETLKAAGDGTWTAYLSLRRQNPAKSDDYPLLGAPTLYDFTLENNKLVEFFPVEVKPQIMLPPIALK